MKMLEKFLNGINLRLQIIILEKDNLLDYIIILFIVSIALTCLTVGACLGPTKTLLMHLVLSSALHVSFGPYVYHGALPSSFPAISLNAMKLYDKQSQLAILELTIQSNNAI
jgi:hypothetical protein